MSETWSIAVGTESTSALVDRAPEGRGVYVLAHGAGGHMADRGMTQLAPLFVDLGLHVVRFNFLYREKHSGRPDPMPQLMAATAAVVERVRAEFPARQVIIGGRSMGGRAASMLAADGYDCAGLLLLAYPLHPEGKPQQLRDAHLPAIRVPVLCFNGTRDDLCTPELMQQVLARVGANWRMHWLDGADHSFRVLKRSGRSDAEVRREVADATREWLAELAA